MALNRLFDILYYQRDTYPQKEAVKSWRDSKWHIFSSQECVDLVESLAVGLIEKGVNPGEKVGIISQVGSVEWNIVDFALQMIGAIPVPFHSTARRSQIEFILEDADIHLCFASEDKYAELLLNSIKEGKRTLEIYSFAQSDNYGHWKKLIRPISANQNEELIKRASLVQSQDLATIIYTSGTTGDPKGVMLSHHNILSNIQSTAVLIPIHAGLRTLSYLPLSHVFERMVIFTYWMAGCSIIYARSVETILEDLQSVKPHYFTSVPRLLERVYEGLLAETSKGNKFKKGILSWAIRLGENYIPNRKVAPLFWLKRKVAHVLVYRHWKNLIGGKIRGVIVGAAALQPRLGKLFSAAGIKIREGYGLTETSPVVAFNRFEPGGNRFGTVGIPVPGVKIKIDAPSASGEGEILVRGPNVMMGYYQRPEITAEVIDENGWFHTGDTGIIVHKHFLKITGRKKDIFKTTTGKYVAPYHVETALKSNIFISQCMVLGSGKPHPGALIIPNFNHLENWCKENDVHWTGPQFMVLNPKVKQLIENCIKEINRELSKEEKVRQYFLLHREWSVQTGEYGPTLKPIRSAIRKKYSKEITKLFEAKDNFVPK